MYASTTLMVRVGEALCLSEPQRNPEKVKWPQFLWIPAQSKQTHSEKWPFTVQWELLCHSVTPPQQRRIIGKRRKGKQTNEIAKPIPMSVWSPAKVQQSHQTGRQHTVGGAPSESFVFFTPPPLSGVWCSWYGAHLQPMTVSCPDWLRAAKGLQPVAGLAF